MANRKEEPEFTVTDRRRFSAEGESSPPASPVPENPPSSAPAEPAAASPEPPAGPTADQRDENTRLYQESTAALDDQIRRELGDRANPDDLKAGFDRIVEPLYVTALVQLGFMGQEGQAQRRIDIIGARQSIDSLSLLQEKTKGNLTQSEARLLEDILYDIRMKYLEITNALARAVQNPPDNPPGGSLKI
jgi:hypothetical protein